MQIENDYDKEVYNGDLGFITKIDAEAGEISVNFDGREITYESGELDSLVLAYATTIHKAQGSEYPAVILPVTTQHYADASAQSSLHRPHARKAACRARRTEEGGRDRGAQCFRAEEVVQIAGMARAQGEQRRTGKSVCRLRYGTPRSLPTRLGIC